MTAINESRMEFQKFFFDLRIVSSLLHIHFCFIFMFRVQFNFHWWQYLNAIGEDSMGPVHRQIYGSDLPPPEIVYDQSICGHFRFDIFLQNSVGFFFLFLVELFRFPCPRFGWGVKATSWGFRRWTSSKSRPKMVFTLSTDCWEMSVVAFVVRIWERLRFDMGRWTIKYDHCLFHYYILPPPNNYRSYLITI